MLDLNEQTTPDLTTETPRPTHTGPETFLLDAEGKVLASTATAGCWWDLDSADALNGMAFAELFAISGADSGSAPESAGWTLLESSINEPIPASARTVAGDIELEIVLRKTTGAVPGVVYSAHVSVLDPATAQSTADRNGKPSDPRRPILHDTTIATFDLDFTNGSARFSPAWWAMLGYTKSLPETTPDHLLRLVHPDDSEALPNPETTAEPGSERSLSAEIRMGTESGDWLWVQLEGGYDFAPDGRINRLSGVMVDITARRELEEETLSNESRFFRLISGGAFGYFEINFESDHATYSPEFAHAVGLNTDDLGSTADGFMGLLPSEDAEAGAEAFFAALDTEREGLLARYTLRHSDGRPLRFQAALNFRRNRMGILTSVSGLQFPEVGTGDSSADAIPDGLAKAALETLDAAAESIAIVDRDGAIVHANAKFLQTAGRTLDELSGTPFGECLPLINRTTGEPAPDLVARLLGGAPALTLDHSYALRDSEVTEDVVITCMPLVGSRNRIDGATVLIRRPLEMPLSPAELVASNRMEGLGRMASGIAHDFNNLLTTVAGGISLAKQKRDWAPIETAEKACNNARTLARQLLTFARGSTAGREVDDIRTIIQDTVRMAGAGARTQFEVDLAEDLHLIEFDSAQMVQVFTNLVLNAMQVMRNEGRITIRAVNMPLAEINSVDLPAGDYVRIDVQDTGPGISAENLARIFQPFFTTRKDGTGLGLSTVRSIIAQHNGAIDAVSSVGSGTTFTLYLPRSYKERVTEKQTAPSISHGSGSVLVMDDDSDLCMIATGILSMLGYEADAARDGEEALAKYRKVLEYGRPYSAVILDLTIPGGLGGEDVLQELRKLDPDVCAIVSSGYATEEQTAHYKELGFAGVLAKPYRSADLGRVLKEALAEHARAAGK